MCGLEDFGGVFTGTTDELQLSFDFQYSVSKVLKITFPPTKKNQSLKGFIFSSAYGCMHNCH